MNLVDSPAQKAPVILPLVSVLIRTKDRPELLFEAIGSVVAQSYSELELVVVNDGGQDVTGVITEFEKQGRFSHLVCVNHPESRGRAAAANTALDHASGEYCIFLDDDDLFWPSHISGLVAGFDGGQTEYRVVYTGVQCMDRSGITVFNSPWEPGRLRAENFLPINAVLFSRGLCERCRFDEDLDVFEDWDFWLQMAQLTTFLHLDHVSAEFRPVGNSAVGLGNTDMDRALAARTKVYEKWRRRWSAVEVADMIDSLRTSTARTVQARIDDYVKQVVCLRHEKQALVSSNCWKLTAPLRWLSRFWRD